MEKSSISETFEDLYEASEVLLNELRGSITEGKALRVEEILKELRKIRDFCFDELYFHDGKTMFNLQEYKVREKCDLIHLAVKAPGDNIEVLDILRNYGVSIERSSYYNLLRRGNGSSTGYLPLKCVDVPAPVVLATIHGKINRVKWFEAKGICLDRKFENSTLLLNIAAKHGHKDLFKMLFEKSEGFYREGIRKYPLQEACLHSLDMLKFIVDFAHEKGIDLENCVSEILEDNLRCNVEEYESSKYYEIVKYLVTQFKSSSENLKDSLQKLNLTYCKEKLDRLEKCYKEVYPDTQEVKPLGESEVSKVEFDHIS